MISQTGGKLLGQGVYGCTFEPVPFCAGGSVFKTVDGMPAVGKVTTDDISDELSIGKAIMALPLAKQYFALPTLECKPAMPINDPDVKECSVIQEADKDETFSMLIMPSAGISLSKYALDLHRMATNYKRIFTHLLEGAVIYQNAGYVHNDIHLGNILVDSANVARYIDYGLAFKLADVKTWDDANLGSQFKPKYVWQAPEVHGWRMILNRIRLSDGIEQLKDINPEYSQFEHQFPQNNTVTACLRSLFINSEFVNKRDGAGFVQAYGKKFDSWRIGLAMWFIWSDLLKSLSFMATPLYGEGRLIRSVIAGLVDFDPRKRLTVGQALALLDPKSRFAS